MPGKDRFQSTLPARGATHSDKEEQQRAGFQSTLPARGATSPAPAALRPSPYFNPRSPHGERQIKRREHRRNGDFNPRSPHGERHEKPLAVSCGDLIFQSTLPARGATHGGFAWLGADADFNPRSPHGERPSWVQTIMDAVQFQSTLPARGATCSALPPHNGGRISIHAPRTGSDQP